MKNLTLLENADLIIQNHVHSIEYERTQGTSDLQNYGFLSPNRLIGLFRTVRQIIGHNSTRLYAMCLPMDMVLSDCGTVNTTVRAVEQRFLSLGCVRDYLVNELLNDNEVYIYTIAVKNIRNPYEPPTKEYLLRCGSVNRGLWSELIEEGRNFRDMMSQIVDNTFNKKEVLTPNQNIKKHKF